MSFPQDLARIVTASQDEESLENEDNLLVSEAKETFENGNLEEIVLSGENIEVFLSQLEEAPSPEEIQKVLQAIEHKKSELKNTTNS